MQVGQVEGGFIWDDGVADLLSAAGDKCNVDEVGKEHKINTIGSVVDLLRVLETLAKGSSRRIWYRGHAHASWKLLAKRFREKTPVPYDFVEIDGQRLGTRTPEPFDPAEFARPLKAIRKVLKRHGIRRVSNGDLLAFAQHYGVDTPLLDWSNSPLVALWFALQDQTELDPVDPPILWLFDPELSMEVSQIKPEPDSTGSRIRDLDDLYAGLSKWGEVYPEWPLPVSGGGEFASRIGRQSGQFTYATAHPYFSGEPLWNRPPSKDGARVYGPIVLDVGKAEYMLEELRLLGIYSETVYGPTSLDTEVKREFKKDGLTSAGRRDAANQLY
jgi:hypothetical protein